MNENKTRKYSRCDGGWPYRMQCHRSVSSQYVSCHLFWLAYCRPHVRLTSRLPSVWLQFVFDDMLSHAKPLLHELDWLLAGATHQVQVGRTDHLHCKIDVYITAALLEPTPSSIRSLLASSAALLQVPFRRTSFGKRSFSTAAPSIWNSLPTSVLNCDTLSLFKSRLKTHLFFFEKS